MYIDEEGHEVHESGILKKPKHCGCPQVIKEAVASRGINCQKLFQLAYEAAGWPGPLARAIFVRFIAEGAPTELIPKPVLNFAERAKMMPGNSGNSDCSGCMACMLEPNAFLSYEHGYSIIHPQVDRAYLKNEAINSSAKTPGKKSDMEEAWLALVESGAVDGNTEDFGSLMRDDENLN